MRTRSNTSRAFWLGTAALSLVSGAAFAQAVGPAAPPVEEVVVTGSHIHGVAPVGSTVISVDTQELQKQGSATAVELLSNLPQVTDIGSSSSAQNSGRNLQGGAGNQSYASSINLRGLGAQNTLNLVNGMRLVPEQTGDIWDIDAVPSMLIRNIDIVADGGSATYGADAITGTVNLILKQPTNTFEMMARGGYAPGRPEYQAGVLGGRTWNAPGLGEGGIMVAVQYYHTDPLYATDRPRIYNDDLSPYLGAAAPSLPTFTNPGNVVIGANTYAIPGDVGGTQGVTLGQLGPKNQPTRQSIFSSISRAEPANTRWNTGFNARQEITNWLTFFAQGYGEWRRASAFKALGGVQAQTISVPSTNPYSPCAPAAVKTNSQGITCPTNGTITVQENIQGEIGSNMRVGLDKQYDVAAGFNVDLPFKWKGTVESSYGQGFANGNVLPSANTTALAQVVTGTGKPSSVPFFNPFCSDNVTGSACNDPATIAYISAFSQTRYTNILSETTINVDGPIWSLPGGEVRLALGGEYDNESLFANAASNTSNAIGAVLYEPAHARRNVAAYYAELYVPLVSAANAMPGIESLELTLANRYTAYSDFGVTDNPKVGIDYSPIDGLKLRTSYGTSFRAPSLRDASAEIATSLHNANVNSSLYAGINSPANVQLSNVEATGGLPAIRPETAITWSLGAKWSPSEIEGLDIDINYYSISAKSVIAQVARDAGDPGVVNAPGGIYDDYLIFNPTYFPTRAVASPAARQINPGLTAGAPLTQAQYNGVISTAFANPVYGFPALPPNPIIFYCQCQRNNGGPLYTDGLDIAASYQWDLDWARARVAGIASYVNDYDTGLTPTSPVVDLNNSMTYALRFSTRLQAGLDRDGFSGTVYVNYKNRYHIDSSLLPPSTPAQYFNVPSYTTFDMSLSYAPEGDDAGSYLADSRISLSIINIGNQGPPLALNAVGINYDATQASDLGRRISLTINKRF